MQELSSRQLVYLFTATKAVRHDKLIFRPAAYGWEQHLFTGGHRNVVVAFLQAETAGHAAAAGIWYFNLQPRGPQQRHVGLRGHHCLVMTMAVIQHAAGHGRWLMVWGVLCQKFRQGHGLVRQLLGLRVERKQIHQLVSKDRHTTWLQTDHRQIGEAFLLQRFEDLSKLSFGLFEHA